MSVCSYGGEEATCTERNADARATWLVFTLESLLSVSPPSRFRHDFLAQDIDLPSRAALFQARGLAVAVVAVLEVREGFALYVCVLRCVALPLTRVPPARWGWEVFLLVPPTG